MSQRTLVMSQSRRYLIQSDKLGTPPVRHVGTVFAMGGHDACLSAFRPNVPWSIRTSFRAPVHSASSAVRYPFPAPNSTNVLSATLPCAAGEDRGAGHTVFGTGKAPAPQAYAAVLEPSGC